MGVNVANIELGFHANPPGSHVDLIFRYHFGNKGIDVRRIVPAPYDDAMIAAAKVGGVAGRTTFDIAAKQGVQGYQFLTASERDTLWAIASRWK